MEVYLVGGAVRDALLGLPLNDRDWVVVGSTPEELVAQGFLPVGRDFPVFLHPVSREEYALARTERKTGPGYRGFTIHAAPEVTLLEDLARRDISINAMAYAASDAERERHNPTRQTLKLDPARLVDPFGGQADLQRKVLRHITPAFREDPVRILRVARFAARFTDFSVWEDTLQLMRAMVQAGETRALVAERVWQELQQGLMAARPSRMVALLKACGALQDVLPPLLVASPMSPDQEASGFQALDQAAARNASLPVRFACLMHRFEAHEAFLRRVPRECSALANLLAKEWEAVAQSANASASELVDLFERADAFRRPERFGELIECCVVLQATDTRRLASALAPARNAGPQAAAIQKAARKTGITSSEGTQIAAAIRHARVQAVTLFLGAN